MERSTNWQLPFGGFGVLFHLEVLKIPIERQMLCALRVQQPPPVMSAYFSDSEQAEGLGDSRLGQISTCPFEDKISQVIAKFILSQITRLHQKKKKKKAHESDKRKDIDLLH